MGWAILPFVISIIYSASDCGKKKIPAWKDIVALLGCLVVFRLELQLLLKTDILDSLPSFFTSSFGFAFLNVPMFLGVYVYLVVLYANFNRSADAPAESGSEATVGAPTYD